MNLKIPKVPKLRAKPTSRKRSVATVREYATRLRTNLRRLESMSLSIPPDNYQPEVVIKGRYIFVDGQRITPSDLESMRGKSAAWQLPVIGAVEQELARLEFDIVKRTKRRPRKTSLGEAEVATAIAGGEFVESEDVADFEEWLTSPEDDSPGQRKNMFYHEFGATSITRDNIVGFLAFMGVEAIEEL